MLANANATKILLLVTTVGAVIGLLLGVVGFFTPGWMTMEKFNSNFNNLISGNNYNNLDSDNMNSYNFNSNNLDSGNLNSGSLDTSNLHSSLNRLSHKSPPIITMTMDAGLFYAVVHNGPMTSVIPYIQTDWLSLLILFALGASYVLLLVAIVFIRQASNLYGYNNKVIAQRKSWIGMWIILSATFLMVVPMAAFTALSVQALGGGYLSSSLTIHFNYSFYLTWAAIAIVIKSAIGSILAYVRLKNEDVGVQHMPML